jgi:phosphoadenosine phosphosulfate reductase
MFICVSRAQRGWDHVTMMQIWRPPEAAWTEDRETAALAAGDLLARIAAAHPSAAIATSLQAEDAVLVDLAARVGAEIALVTLETGRLDPETVQARAAIEARYRRSILVFAPDAEEVDAWVARHGAEGFYDGLERRRECCAMRKVRPLARALWGRAAWVTGQRREQAASRTDLSEHEFDVAHGIEKFNPLAAWSLDDVWAYVRHHDVPVNALYARGYASIGCAPCTRAIRASEEPRAGRWWWEQSDTKECGLHVAAAHSDIRSDLKEGQLA